MKKSATLTSISYEFQDIVVLAAASFNIITIVVTLLVSVTSWEVGARTRSSGQLLRWPRRWTSSQRLSRKTSSASCTSGVKRVLMEQEFMFGYAWMTIAGLEESCGARG